MENMDSIQNVLDICAEFNAYIRAEAEEDKQPLKQDCFFGCGPLISNKVTNDSMGLKINMDLDMDMENFIDDTFIGSLENAEKEYAANAERTKWDNEPLHVHNAEKVEARKEKKYLKNKENAEIAMEQNGISKAQRPDITYPLLIAVAIISSSNSLDKWLLVEDIYKEICLLFPYFKTIHSKWKNCVRHALDSNKNFLKRGDQRMSRRCEWGIDPCRRNEINKKIKTWLKKHEEMAECLNLKSKLG